MMSLRSSMRASNDPRAGVETAPRSAGGVMGVVVVDPAMKWTSLYSWAMRSVPAFPEGPAPPRRHV